MTSLSSLVRRGDTGSLSPVARRVAIALAVLTPLLIAGVAVTALVSPAQSAATTSGPSLPAAVVNLDQMVQIDQDGTETPVLAGKLLVSELTSADSGQGFTWNVTDAGTAAGGLESGQYAAVVTIPSNFSSSYVSLSGSDPVQAVLDVQTNGANSYVTEMLASALSANLQSALSTQTTEQFVTQTLGAFTTLNGSIGDAATAAGQITGGAGTLADGATKLSGALAQATDGAVKLNTGTQAYAAAMNEIAVGTADLPTYAGYLADGTALVSRGVSIARQQILDRSAESSGIFVLQQNLVGDIDRLLVTMPAGPEREALVAIRDQADGVRWDLAGHTALLDLDDFGMDVLDPGAALVNSGATLFAEDLPLLTTSLSAAATAAGEIGVGTSGLATGLGEISTGSAGLAKGANDLTTAMGELAGGLDQAATAIPSYTADQERTLAAVVANPIVTEKSDIAALPSPAAAIAAVAVPLALWIGAFAIYLMLAPFTRGALASTASTVRVVLSALLPAVVLALVQAAIVAVVLFVVGASPAHVAGSILFSLFMSVAFVTLHQGLVALFGQAGRLLSLGLVVVQIAAAAVIIPNGLSSPLYTGLSSLLPLSHAITGMHALIGGGSLAVAGQEALVLLVFAAIGLALSLIAVTRQRGRSTVAAAAPPPSPSPAHA